MTQAIVKRDQFHLYLRELGAHPILSREEEHALAMRWWEVRDREAGQKLVLSHLRLVVKIAKEFTRYGHSLADLVQEGNLGLLHAVDRFDPRKGFRLMTYAVWWIRAYIQSYVVRSWSIVRMGTTRAQRKVMNGLQKARQKISAMTSDRAPELKELAEVLDVTKEEVRETITRMQARDLSLDQPVSAHDESASTVGELLADEEALSPEDQVIQADQTQMVRDRLDEVYDELTPRERFLLERRLLSESPITLEAVGHEFGVTRERVRQIESRLKKKLAGFLAPVVEPSYQLTA